MPSNILTYQGLIDSAAKLLYACSETPRIDAEILLQHATQESLAWLIARGDNHASSDHMKSFFALLEQRQAGQPIAYICGYRDFWTLTLKVNQDVLIPRSDTETLVEQSLEKISADLPCNLLDLGTGSGAIALALASERSQAQVLAVDSQEKALIVAKQNAESNGLKNVDFLHSNWFENIPNEHKFDLIAANPPYVEAGDPHLEQGDLRFEPDTALIADKHGLADLQTIINNSPKYLKKNGWLLVEHGYKQAEQVKQLFSQSGFCEIELFTDINQLPRCSAGQWRL
ncbi:MAG: release factor glutamine methyltransferase [Cryomorphaceae bacterium]|jgi:release factor glutamine methyltransferase